MGSASHHLYRCKGEYEDDGQKSTVHEETYKDKACIEKDYVKHEFQAVCIAVPVFFADKTSICKASGYVVAEFI